MDEHFTSHFSEPRESFNRSVRPSSRSSRLPSLSLMCGIIGYSGRFDHGALLCGMQSLAHRGPDDSGSFFDDAAAVGLAHTRLSIIDLSPLGHQPMSVLMAS